MSDGNKKMIPKYQYPYFNDISVKENILQTKSKFLFNILKHVFFFIELCLFYLMWQVLTNID